MAARFKDYPTKVVVKSVKKALYRFQMLEDGETIVVGVSGGIDSLSMLDALLKVKPLVPVDYNLYPVYIPLGTDPCAGDRVRAFLKRYDLNCEVLDVNLLDGLESEKNKCYWCSRRRRRLLFEVCERVGANKVALGHIKDDFAEAFLLNIVFSGETGCFNPKQDFFKGRFYIIRPMVYVEKSFVRRYARSNGIEDLSEDCPYSSNSKREVIRRMIKIAYSYDKRVIKNIFSAISNINERYLFKG